MFFHTIHFVKDKICKIADLMKIFFEYFMHTVWKFDYYVQIMFVGLIQSIKLCFIKAFEDNANALVHMSALENY